MEYFELLNNKEIIRILNDFEVNHLKKGSYDFNIFSLSSYGNQLENFHSDVIAQLINPKGLHQENDLLLGSFIAFLNKKGADVNIANFRDVTVYREKGRIDIAIIDNSSKCAIIIENKINNAPDMNDQLERYYTWCAKHEFTVICTVYLTLTGEKKSPSIQANPEFKPLSIEAFSNSEYDLVNGWIIPSIGLCNYFDTASLLKQYSKLIINLAYNKMNSEILDEFYILSDDMSAIDKIKQLKELSNQVPKYRTDKFVNNLLDFKPFTKSYRYKPHYMLYERYLEADNSFKLDVWFEESGCAQIHFWNPEKNEDDALLSIRNKIEEIGYLELMKESNTGWVGYYKRFEFLDYESLSLMDEKILEFVRLLLRALEKSKETIKTQPPL